MATNHPQRDIYMPKNEDFDIDAPLWDPKTFAGRFKHYLWMSDPRMCLASDKELYKAKALVEQYRDGAHPPGTTREQLVLAKQLYEGAFHPDTGDKLTVLGRMSCMVPSGMFITGAMLTFYRSIQAVLFWQWVNQSLNSIINYSNRNAEAPINRRQLATTYLTATAAAMLTASGLNHLFVAKGSLLMQKYVPIAAVSAAHFMNIPLMRQKELLEGVDVKSDKKQKGCKSRVAAAKGIFQVIVSRIVIAAPSMLTLPIIVYRLEQFPWFPRTQWFQGVFHACASGCILFVMVPVGCALFPQKCSIKSATIARFEPTEFKKLEKQFGENIPDILYFNKGL